jgi:uncharacterized membrane protein HdeD (DUF308 family)
MTVALEPGLLLSRVWWLYVVRGVLAVLFGILALVLPTAALIALVFVFGFYVGLSGVVSLLAAFSREAEVDAPRWLLVLQGLAGILAAAAAFTFPGLTAIVLLSIVAVWAVITGIIEVMIAIRLRREIEGEWRLIMAGARPGVNATRFAGSLVFVAADPWSALTSEFKGASL